MALFVLILVPLLAQPAVAEEGDNGGSADGALPGRVDQLETENAELRERVAALENGGVSAAADEALEDIEEEEEEEGGIGLGIRAERNNIIATLQIFGAVEFGHNNPAPPGGGHTSFAFGEVSFFGVAQIEENFHVLSETVIKGGTGGPHFDQERLWGKWEFSDVIWVKFGLEHGQVSRWNRIFHHGRWLETSISRPMLARFESSGFMPSHNTGLEVGGRTDTGAGLLEYMVSITNGRGSVATNPQKGSDGNDDKAFELALNIRPAGTRDLQVGIFLRTDDIPADSTVAARAGEIMQRIATAFIDLRRGKIGIMTEFAYVEDDDSVSGQTFRHKSAYIQIEWQKSERTTPYARLDWRDMDRGDPYYVELDRDLDRYEILVGVRQEITNNAALKLEVGFGEHEARASNADVRDVSYFRIAVQLSWVF
ncbi:MAG: hypothetical protein V3T86_05460 [Planctomycetota bacterium]